MKARRITTAAAALVLAASMMQAQAVFASTHEEYNEVALDTGADRNSQIVSVNVPITIEGKELRLVATGLREDNKDAFIKAIEDNYKTSESTPLYIQDASFVDAEKFDVISPIYDSALCWAASASNVLWLTGWAQQYADPLTGNSMNSEDDVFELFRKGFINKGGETNKGFDWFFDGIFFVSGSGKHSFPINQQDPALGVEKSFVASEVCDVYDVTKAPSDISKLLNLDRESDDPCGFGLSIGGTFDDYLGMPEHAVTAEGIIYDPEEEDLANRYKAVIIIDSDNDADAEYELDPEEEPDTERLCNYKAARPNSYTVYDLKNRTLQDGHNVWELVNYSSDATYPYVIFDIMSFPLYDRELIDANKETEGSAKQYENVDLVLDYIFTTNQDEPQFMPFKDRIEEDAVRDFSMDDMINLNVFVANQSSVVLNKDYPGGNKITFEWTVTNKADGSVAWTGTEQLEEDIYTNTESAFLLHLNNKDGALEKWEPGEYTVTLKINPDKAVIESYYLNNKDMSFDFTIYPDAIEESSVSESESETSSETGSDITADSDTDSKPDSKTAETAYAESKPDADSKSPEAVNTASAANPSTGAAAGALAAAAIGAAAIIVSKKKK